MNRGLYIRGVHSNTVLVIVVDNKFPLKHKNSDYIDTKYNYEDVPCEDNQLASSPTHPFESA
jgi:hypothetical protein